MTHAFFKAGLFYWYCRLKNYERCVQGLQTLNEHSAGKILGASGEHYERSGALMAAFFTAFAQTHFQLLEHLLPYHYYRYKF